MKHKLLAIAAICTTSFVCSAQAKVKVGAALDMDLSVVAQYNNFNLVLGDKGVAVDYLFKKGQFDAQTPLTWYVGGGGYIGWDHGFGVRAPLGVEWNFSKGWDAYAQVHPELDFDDGTDFSVDAGIGVRYAF